jgi:cytochrome d ubiquinol oxidase subunit II
VIVGGALMFAAFPEWYATVFSGAYLVLLIILLALIARGVSFEYRHQGKGVRWTRSFDWMIFFGSAIPALLWGAAFANIVRGMPMESHTQTVGDLTFVSEFNYTGSLLDLLNPYALLGGLTTLALFFYHGLTFISRKTDGDLRERAHKLAIWVGVAVAVLALAFLGWTVAAYFSLVGLVLSAVAVVAFLASWVAHLRRRDGVAFAFGCATVIAAVWSLFAALYPALMRNLSGGEDLTIWNGAASETTLTIMAWAFLVIMPLVIGYQAWSFWTFRKRLRREDFESHADAPAIAEVRSAG